MTDTDRIAQMAREAGYQHPDAVGSCEDFAYFDLAAFARLVAEDCATLARDWPAPVEGRVPLEIAHAIRARYSKEG